MAVVAGLGLDACSRARSTHRTLEFLITYTMLLNFFPTVYIATADAADAVHCNILS